MIIREHDLDDDNYLLPMLDCAHMVFNAGTGVSAKAEREEIRGFRPVHEWIEIVESRGFTDSKIYEMQPNDPTVDIMMCFFKNPRVSENEGDESSAINYSEKQFVSAKLEGEIAESNPTFLKVLDHAPQFVLNIGIQLISALLSNVPVFREWLGKVIIGILPESLQGLKGPINANLDSVSNIMRFF